MNKVDLSGRAPYQGRSCSQYYTCYSFPQSSPCIVMPCHAMQPKTCQMKQSEAQPHDVSSRPLYPCSVKPHLHLWLVHVMCGLTRLPSLPCTKLGPLSRSCWIHSPFSGAPTIGDAIAAEKAASSTRTTPTHHLSPFATTTTTLPNRPLHPRSTTVTHQVGSHQPPGLLGALPPRCPPPPPRPTPSSPETSPLLPSSSSPPSTTTTAHPQSQSAASSVFFLARTMERT